MQQRVISTSDGHRVEGCGPDGELVNGFLSHLVARAFSPATVRAYAYDLLNFLRFLTERGAGLRDVVATDLFDYLDWQQRSRVGAGKVVRLTAHRGAAPATMNRRIAAVRGLFLERRAGENRIDFIEGVATALTPIAFFETVMVKSYETLVDSDTSVDVNTGIVAASRLQSLIDSRDYSHDLLVMKVQLGHICDAVKSTVPQEMWGEIVEKIEELEQHPEALDVGTDSFDDADDDAYDPTAFIDEDDEY